MWFDMQYGQLIPVIATKITRSIPPAPVLHVFWFHAEPKRAFGASHA